MDTIAFIDTEVGKNSHKILDIGGIKTDGREFHSSFISDFINFLHGSQYICGHNIFNHDLKYIHDVISDIGIHDTHCIDTLFLSPLLFPAKPYHALPKNDKLQSDELNNPLNDSKKARDLFFEEVTAFEQLDASLKQILYSLLNDKKEFLAFFHCIGYQTNITNLEKTIRDRFYSQICEQADISKIIIENPIELAYCLALINTGDRYSISPPWVLNNYPATKRVMFHLRSNPCLRGCGYCYQYLDVRKGLKHFFGFDYFRTYEGEPLQEKAAKAAIANKSLLAVFPTGGGKSISFQVPALMSGINMRGLTVVISPLQSLMKDQVDNLENLGITDAVTINGSQDPIERAQSLERAADGRASLLYISPESLRSKTIERLLLERNVVRFVIDEAHCLSSWGQDFRVDYLYIGDFIKSLQKKKNLQDGIPVSCFTATAKLKVIEDIRNYFKSKLALDMEPYVSQMSRKNLRYQVLKQSCEEEKYSSLRNLVEAKKCPAIVYVSRTKMAEDLAKRLTDDGYPAKPYHGKMDKETKKENQDDFMQGDNQIIVATSAFGMGVDKKDVGLVVHYDISDSLENYVQEAGRAGRDEKITADCHILFNDNDLNKHFIRLNQSKLSLQEIRQIWKAVKEVTRLRSKVTQSALEIARKAGWEEGISEIETRVKTAIAALEEAGYLKRGQNSPRIFATGILVKTAQEAADRISSSARFDETQKVNATRIIKSLISSRSISLAGNEEGESRVDYLSDRLGIPKEEVLQSINLLREEKILGDTKDMTVFIKRGENKNRSLKILELYAKIENFLLNILEDQEKTFNIKELNEQAEANGCVKVTPDKIKTIFNFWAIKNWIRKHIGESSKNHITIYNLQPKIILEEKTKQRLELAQFIVEYLYEKSNKDKQEDSSGEEEVRVEFSVLELKQEFEHRPGLFKTNITLQQIEEALFYLSRIEALTIEGGFLVLYNALTIERIEQNLNKRYNADDYQKLDQFYRSKIQQIHIIGEYARKMIIDLRDALQFVDDYFKLNYNSFLHKYFKGSRQEEIGRNITPTKFQQLFGELSPSQLSIINDKDSKCIVVAAGPGSGKTRILVHKLASLLLMEDVKHEQLLMLTFSRVAATEFKKRLIKLIGEAAFFVEMKTFHSYCFDLLGQIGTISKSDEILRETIKRIKNGEVEINRITKTVLVIDEAQDMNADEFALITSLMEQNEEIRVIAVGDDDQNVYEFRGSSSKYLNSLIQERSAKKYELVQNFRSTHNIVDFTNQYVKRIPNRLKRTPIMAFSRDNGKIKMVRYTDNRTNLVIPVVNDILSEGISGSTCVLTRTNDEALKVTGLLLKYGVKAKLIQSQDEFNLYDLLEIRDFLNQVDFEKDVSTISEDVWSEAKRKLAEKLRSNPNLELCTKIFTDFEATNPKIKYKSDLETFIRESKFEDFYGENTETIFVSTIHKAKGREFDNVFLMLDDFDDVEDKAKRQLYVAMTRAKRNLTIHYNGNYLDNIKTENLKKVVTGKVYQSPNEFAMQLTHKDVWLSYFESHQDLVSQLASGDTLIFNNESCCNAKGTSILKFSKQRKEIIDSWKQKNYVPKTAKIKFIVYWKGEDMEKEIRIILPELYFERTG